MIKIAALSKCFLQMRFLTTVPWQAILFVVLTHFQLETEKEKGISYGLRYAFPTG